MASITKLAQVTGVKDKGGVRFTWEDTDNIKSKDGEVPTVVFKESSTLWQTDYLMVRDFDFSVPSGSTVQGVEVAMRRMADNDSVAYYVEDVEFRLLLDESETLGVQNKAKAGNWSTDWVTETYGGESDSWGESLDVSKVNSEYFGFVFRVVNMHSASIANVDYIEMTVFYNEPAPARVIRLRGGVRLLGGIRLR